MRNARLGKDPGGLAKNGRGLVARWPQCPQRLLIAGRAVSRRVMGRSGQRCHCALRIRKSETDGEGTSAGGEPQGHGRIAITDFVRLKGERGVDLLRYILQRSVNRGLTYLSIPTSTIATQAVTPSSRCALFLRPIDNVMQRRMAVAEEPFSEFTAKKLRLEPRIAQHRGNFRWFCGGFEQSDTGESCGVEMAERVGFRTHDFHHSASNSRN